MAKSDPRISIAPSLNAVAEAQALDLGITKKELIEAALRFYLKNSAMTAELRELAAYQAKQTLQLSSDLRVIAKYIVDRHSIDLDEGN
ncbi:MAG: hypothetical protein P0Y65_14220 [Candidatus Devosia phytovorans]|uniref:Uncharacterized protein n=1 Tax=Candidatus Devosia phytovorans TaxID=3121372 RepID=A0AAJ5VRC4_9HYPH|nr:hypothetical protein [Devosia sp.]WEK03343.1 MAG: hypothetical protein P0Y65_14220 [Devosia sp.]